jgi:hypothetical protein
VMNLLSRGRGVMNFLAARREMIRYRFATRDHSEAIKRLTAKLAQAKPKLPVTKPAVP